MKEKLNYLQTNEEGQENNSMIQEIQESEMFSKIEETLNDEKMSVKNDNEPIQIQDQLSPKDQNHDHIKIEEYDDQNENEVQALNFKKKKDNYEEHEDELEKKLELKMNQKIEDKVNEKMLEIFESLNDLNGDSLLLRKYDKI